MDAPITLTKAIFATVVTKRNDIHICVNIKDKTIVSLEFEGAINTYKYSRMVWHPFIDWHAGADDNTYVANVNLEYNDHLEAKPA
jgi:hypothetical protein